MKPRAFGRSCWLVALLSSVIPASAATAGSFTHSLTKTGTWQLPKGAAGWPANAVVNYTYFNHAYTEDPCAGGATERNQPVQAVGQMIGVDPVPGFVPGAGSWPVAGGTAGWVSTPVAQFGTAHTSATAQTLVRGERVLAGQKKVVTALNVNITGEAIPCNPPNRRTYSEAFAFGTIDVPAATLVALTGNMGAGDFKLDPKGGMRAAAWGGSKKKGQVTDPVRLDVLDTVTGEVRSQEIFHFEMDVESGEDGTFTSVAIVDEMTGDLFLSASGGTAAFEYAFTGDWVPNRFGRASVVDGQLFLEGELAGLPWVPSELRGSQPGWLLSHEYLPSLETEITVTDTVPGRTYEVGMNLPLGIADSTDAVPEPVTLLLFIVGAVHLLRPRWHMA